MLINSNFEIQARAWILFCNSKCISLLSSNGIEISFSSVIFFLKANYYTFSYSYLNFQWDTTFRVKSRAFACVLRGFGQFPTQKYSVAFPLQVEYNSIVIKPRPSKTESQALFSKLFSSALLPKLHSKNKTLISGLLAALFHHVTIFPSSLPTPPQLLLKQPKC